MRTGSERVTGQLTACHFAAGEGGGLRKSQMSHPSRWATEGGDRSPPQGVPSAPRYGLLAFLTKRCRDLRGFYLVFIC